MSQSNLPTIIIAIIILAIIGSALYLFGNTEQTNQNEITENSNNGEGDMDSVSDMNADENENTVTVTYTDKNRFTPEIVTITRGETVQFVNETTNPMWVATDEHPTHTNYAGTSLSQHCSNGSENAFDQCEIGETFTFTFNQIGTWEYHNHLLPNDQGSVTVE